MPAFQDQLYTREFYEDFQKGSRESAEQIAPLVLALVECKSVIDIGCGPAAWLSVFEELGVSDVLGVDGDYVDTSLLQISPEKFVPFDISKGFKTDLHFDLAISLEVAEHISEKNVDTYFDSLVKLAPFVLFSAAIPFQEGHNHVNEQWPDYWVNHFERRGFVAIDCIRRRIWQDPRVEWWYAQNAMLFVRKDRLQFYPALREAFENSSTSPLPIVHPRLFQYKESRLNQLRLENEHLRNQLEHLRSPLYMLSNLPRVAARKLAGLMTRLRTETR